MIETVSLKKKLLFKMNTANDFLAPHDMDKLNRKFPAIGAKYNQIKETIKTLETGIVNRELCLAFVNGLYKEIKILIKQYKTSSDEIIDLCENNTDEVETPDNFINKTTDNFMNIKRKCPICLDIFKTNQFVFAPCSHYYCVTCFGHLEECPFKCKVSLSACIVYEKSGDNLKFKLVPDRVLSDLLKKLFEQKETEYDDDDEDESDSEHSEISEYDNDEPLEIDSEHSEISEYDNDEPLEIDSDEYETDEEIPTPQPLVNMDVDEESSDDEEDHVNNNTRKWSLILRSRKNRQN